MENSWKLIYPKAGRKWYYVRTLIQAGELVEYVEENRETHDIIAKGFFGNKPLMWVFDNQQKVKAFFFTMKEALNRTKIRMESRKKALVSS